MSSLKRALHWPYSRSRQIVIGLMLLRAISVILLINGYPALDSHLGFYFHHGGDQRYYYSFAEQIATGNFINLFSVQVGFPSLWAMAIRLGMHSGWEDILPTGVTVVGILLGSFSVAVIYKMADALTDNRLVAIFSATIWAMLPLLFWGIASFHPNAAAMQMVNVPLLAWLVLVPDGITTFFAMAAVLFTSQYVKHQSVWMLVGSAIACALIVLFRLQQVPLLPVVVLALLFSKKLSALVVWSVTFFSAYFAQLWYVTIYKVVSLQPDAFQTWIPTNYYFGYVYVENGQLLTNPANNPTSIARVLTLLNPFLVIGVLVAAGIILPFFIRRIGWSRTTLMLGAVPAMIILVVTSDVFAQNTVRYLIPALPFVIVLALWVSTALLRLVPKLETLYQEVTT